MGKPGYVYILAGARNGTLYIGVTSNLVQRIHQHREGPIDGFSSKYRVRQLVYFEAFDDITDAIHREKAMKKWRRAWKLQLIEENNPKWMDLYSTITGFPLSRE